MKIEKLIPLFSGIAIAVLVLASYDWVADASVAKTLVVVLVAITLAASSIIMRLISRRSR